MISDPSGFLGRVPELEPVAEEPSIRKAIEGGDPFRIYRALFWARLLGRIRSHREVVDAALANRRLFARPLKGTPSLHTVNSIGTAFVGSSEKAPDGTHIALHAFVLLFVIPILPLGAYVVRDTGGRSWSIFARVPLGTFSWLYGRVLALGAIASVLLAAYGAFHASRHHEVRVLNSFDEPVHVTIGKAKAIVPPRGDATLVVDVGNQRGRAASAGGVEVDSAELRVQGGKHVLVWNLAGGMPLFVVDVRYSDRAATDARPTMREIYCGQRVLTLPQADYAFREPDKTVSVKKGSAGVTKTWLDYPHNRPDVGELCFHQLARQDRAKDALPFLEAAARLAKWKGDRARAAVTVALGAAPERAFELARLARDASPDDLEAHRMYQTAGVGAGKQAAVAAEYRQRADAARDSADAQYLAARLAHGAEARAQIEELAARFPDHSYLMRSLAWARYRAHDFQGGAETWDRLHAQAPQLASEIADEQVNALVALGRAPAALAVTRETFQSLKEGRRAQLALLHARLAALQGAGSPDELIAALEEEDKGEKRWLLRQQSGLQVPESAAAAGLALERAAARDPAAALRVCPQASQLDLNLIERATWALLFGEAVRSGDAKAEQALLRAPRVTPEELAVLRKLARGEPASLDELDEADDVQAAAALIRSRNAALSAPERESLRRQARALDRLRGPVTAALASWKP